MGKESEWFPPESEGTPFLTECFDRWDRNLAFFGGFVDSSRAPVRPYKKGLFSLPDVDELELIRLRIASSARFGSNRDKHQAVKLTCEPALYRYADFFDIIFSICLNVQYIFERLFLET